MDVVMIVSVVVVLLAGAFPRAAAAQGAPFWERVASPARERFDRLFEQADALLSGDRTGGDRTGGDRTGGRRLTQPEKLARAEALLVEALALRGDDFRALLLLAEVQSIAGRPAAAVATLERAQPRAQFPAQEAACWMRLGVERSKLGQYAEAVAAYDRQVALGEGDGTVYANTAEMLMALGRLSEAEDRYREAIRVDEQGPDRRAREHGLALSYYGLGVALDRDDQPAAAREMITRAITIDSNLSKLTIAQQPGADVFFLPEGDVFYYLGLASEVAGRTGDAEAAFREFLARLPKSPWTLRARAHLDTLAARGRIRDSFGGRGAGPALRVVAAGTVLSSGGIPAPLIDAAWRGQPMLLDGCLEIAGAEARASPAGLRAPIRFALELELDAHGAVTQAVAKAPPPLDGAFARCVEAAVKSGLRVSPTGRGRPTRARMELIVAVANPDAAGL